MLTARFGSLAERRGIESSGAQVSRFLARQPILDVQREIFGYELLFRSGWENSFRGDSDDATQKMLDNCLYMGIESIANNQLAFVNCTRESLVDGLVTILPPETTVLEVLETIAPDPELVNACAKLRKMGYTLALDDFVPREEMQPLVEMASYIKVDFRASDASVREQVRRMMHGSEAKLLAEKVESQEEFDAARDEGFEYFQGYFFCRPKIVANREIPPNRMNYLRLLAELGRQPLNLKSVTHAVELEASLCYRLLLLANSPLWGVRKRITSVHDAFIMVGENRFRTLVSVAASCVLSQEQPPALIHLSLERARFCELLAPLVGQSGTEQFMLGLMSLLDAVLGIPMATIANALPIRDEAKAALLGTANPAALPLCLIRGFESSAWAACACTAKEHGLGEETLAQLYVASVKWAGDQLASSQ